MCIRDSTKFSTQLTQSVKEQLNDAFAAFGAAHRRINTDNPPVIPLEPAHLVENTPEVSTGVSPRAPPRGRLGSYGPGQGIATMGPTAMQAPGVVDIPTTDVPVSGRSADGTHTDGRLPCSPTDGDGYRYGPCPSVQGSTLPTDAVGSDEEEDEEAPRDYPRLADIWREARPQDFVEEVPILESDMDISLGGSKSAVALFGKSQPLSNALVTANARLRNPSVRNYRLHSVDPEQMETPPLKHKMQPCQSLTKARIHPDLAPYPVVSRMNPREQAALGFTAATVPKSLELKMPHVEQFELYLDSALKTQACTSSLLSALVAKLGNVPQDAKERRPEEFRMFNNIDPCHVGLFLSGLNQMVKSNLELLMHQRVQLQALVRERVLEASPKLAESQRAALRVSMVDKSGLFQKNSLDEALSASKQDRQDTANQRMADFFARQDTAPK